MLVGHKRNSKNWEMDGDRLKTHDKGMLKCSVNSDDTNKKISTKKIRHYSTCIEVNDVYVLSGVRTPIGRFQGKLSSLNAIQLGSKALIAAVETSNVCKNEIQEVIIGNCFQAGLGQCPAHQIALYSGLSKSITSSTVNKMCASGMKAVITGCQQISSNTNEVVAVGGVESLSNVPYILRRRNMRLGDICLKDLIFHDGINDMFEKTDVTYFVEDTVKEYKYTRQQQDDYALNSYSRAAVAQEKNVFSAEMVPVVLKTKKDEEEIVCRDEEIHCVDVEKFRSLQPETGAKGTITAGNSSGFHDGAAMMILAKGNYVLKKNLKPLAKIVSYAEASVDAKKFTIAPSVVVPKVLLKANLSTDCIALWEISETFAVTALLNTKILKINPDRVNVNGGAISLGHPFGMTGTRIIIHLVHNLCPGDLGCATICHAPGGASAVIVEKMG